MCPCCELWFACVAWLDVSLPGPMELSSTGDTPATPEGTPDRARSASIRPRDALVSALFAKPLEFIADRAKRLSCK